MTGYGVAAGACLGGRIGIEVRTLNHKYCDIRTRVPRDFLPIESQLTSAAKKRISRGHVDLTIRWEERPADQSLVQADLALARAYRDAYVGLAEELGIEGEVDLALLAHHEIVTAREIGDEPGPLWDATAPVLAQALDACLQMREREGAALAEDLGQHLDALAGFREAAVVLVPEAVAQLQARSRERIAELAGGIAVDELRLAQELAFLAERSDIAEELNRIESHLDQFREVIATAGPMGRKLDFLCQELLREVNTVGSKSQSLELTRLVVDFKTELEKLREQAQNVE